MFKRVLIAGVALLAIAITSTTYAQQTAPAQQSAIKRTVLQQTDVPGSNYQVEYALVDIPANTRTGRHYHPGTVFGYLLEGE
jgi:quercetin dioxygenase-like cupin family protein